MDQELFKITRAQVQEGYDDESIKHILLQKGFEDFEIDEALTIIRGDHADQIRDGFSEETMIAHETPAEREYEEKLLEKKNKMNFRIFYAHYLDTWVRTFFALVFIGAFIFLVWYFGFGGTDVVGMPEFLEGYL